MSSNKTSLLETSLRSFFAVRAHAAHAKAFLGPNQSPPTSLRTIDWFVTTYSRRHMVMVLLDDGRVVDLHSSYKSQLKSFSKRRFDVFKRGKTVMFDLDGETIETTWPQLNFFRWLIKYNVAEYITSHAGEIERAMKHYFRQKQEPQAPTKKKRVCSSSSIVARVVFD